MKNIDNPGLFADKLTSWYRKNKRNLPFRNTHNPYNILISELMAQQTQMRTLIPYYERFVNRFPDFQTLADADVSEVLKYWEGLGYYNRARYLHETARTVIDEFQGDFPETLTAIKQLKGVGDYTASAIHSIAFNQPSLAVDGNVSRVISRYMGLKADVLKQGTRKEIADLLRPAIEQSVPRDFTQALMELGALVCTKEPSCEACPLKANCFAYKHDMQGVFPVKAKSKPKTTETLDVVVAEYNGKFVLRKRPDHGLLAGMYEFPQFVGGSDHSRLPSLLGTNYHGVLKPVGHVKHVFTHRIWSMQIFHLTLEKAPNDLYDLRTFPYAIATAHRKIITLLEEKNLLP